MKLKRLVVQGFKSFRDRTTICFNEGITGIVGPNGCGKSNIVDALFWAMGEQSAKHLRGNAMKDLIFAGSSKYTPASWAEATLVLDNNEDRHIHIGSKIARPSEIAITRKIYRNGETEYRINNEQARLRDIQEVFVDTGAGAKSYSIIAQGEIDKFISARPLERRLIIEEVAGIAKFKLRKKESLRKIEQTQINLTRLEDIRKGIEKNLKDLRKQSEKAEKARTLREKIKKHDLIVSSHKLYDIFKNYKINKEMIGKNTGRLQDLELEKTKLEKSLKEERLEREKRSSFIEKLQQEYRDISKKFAASEQRFSFLLKQKKSLEIESETRGKEIKDFTEFLNDRKEKLRELEIKRNDFVEKDEESSDITEMKDNLINFKNELQKKKEKIDTLRNNLDGTIDLKTKNSYEVFKIESNLKSYAENLKDVNEELEKLEMQYSRFSEERTRERNELIALKNKVDILSENEEKEKKIIHNLTKEIEKLQNNLGKKNNDLMKSQLVKKSLMEACPSLKGAKEFISNVNNDNQYYLLGNVINSQEKYAKGVQALISYMLNALVAETKEYPELTAWMKNQSSCLDFISIDQEKNYNEVSEKLRDVGLKTIIPLKTVITMEQHYWKTLSPLFDGFYLVNQLTFDQFKKIDTKVEFKSIATFDGSVIIKNEQGIKIYHFSSPNDTIGLVEKNNLLEKMIKNISNLESEIFHLKTLLKKKREALSTMQNKYDATRNNFIEVNVNYKAKKSEIFLREKSQKDIDFRVNILKNKEYKIAKERLELLESQEELQNLLKNLTLKEDQEQDLYEALLEEEENAQNLYNEKREEYAQIEMNILNYHERIETIDAQIEDIKDQIPKEQERLDLNIVRVQSYNQEILNIEKELEVLKINNEEINFEIDSIELSISREKEKLQSLAKEMNDREDNVKHLFVDINKYEKQIFESKTKMENYINEEEKYSRDIFEKYKIDLREVLGNILEYNNDDLAEFNDLSFMYTMISEHESEIIEKENYTFVKKYGKDLIDCQQKFKQYKSEYMRLGDINRQAVNDYEQQKVKWDFLKSQENELKSSLEDLEKAIVHIDERSKKRFKSAFEDVNTRFEKVFPVIFGGGSARLEITGNIEDSECGVDIVAKPPGKKMQNINLMSGGEKALTAVGLVFSIFLVRPSPFCLLDEVDAPLDDANIERFNELLKAMSKKSQFILVTHNKKTMEFNDTLYGITMQEPGVSRAVSVQLH